MDPDDEGAGNGRAPPDVSNPLVWDGGSAGKQIQHAAQPSGGGALVSVEQQRAIAEVQARMLVARANPRMPIRAVDSILEDCRRPSLAEVAEYEFARGGTSITGPTIKLVEAIARRWGNVGSGIREISRGIDQRGVGFSECMAYAWDLETGYYDERQYQIRHWRDTQKGGYPIKDERDIYELIANMGQRRKRAVLLAILPPDIVEAAVTQCKQTLKATADTSPATLQKLADGFAEFGISKAQLEARLQRRLDTITPAQIIGLRRIYASLRDGMAEPGDFFQPEEVGPGAEQGKAAGGSSKLRETMASRQSRGGDAPPAGQGAPPQGQQQPPADPPPEDRRGGAPPAQEPAQQQKPPADPPAPVQQQPSQQAAQPGGSAQAAASRSVRGRKPPGGGFGDLN